MSLKKIFLSIFVTVCLCGCNPQQIIEEKLNQWVLESSGITQDEDYTEYRSLSETGLLDEEGRYLVPASDTCSDQCDEQPTGAVHVSFPENSYLNTRFFLDADFRETVDMNNCWLNPGDTLFAMDPKPFHPNSNMYVFKEFRVYAVNEDGSRVTSPLLKFRPSKKGYALLIPLDFSGREISVETVGKYKDRILTFSDFYVDETGKMTELSGNWTVNGKKVGSDSVAVSPVESFTVTYTFPTNGKYYFVNSVPDFFYQNDVEGKVVFSTLDAQSNVSDYRIELHPYIHTDLAITTKGFNLQSRMITINGKEERMSWKGGLKTHLTGLKWGDKLEIESESELEFQSEELRLFASELRNGFYHYTLEVPEPVKTFYFDPSEYNYEHGTLVFRYRGMEVTEPLYVIDGSEISYEAAEIEDGYWLPGEARSVRVIGNDTKDELEAIRFYPKKPVRVYLSQPEAGGNIDYYIDGLPVTESQKELDCGTMIEMNFRNWNGWISSAIDGETYIVGEKDSQIVSVNGLDVNRIFYESEGHKSHVIVEIDYSVGSEASFSVSTADAHVSGKNYDLTGFNNSKQVIFDKIVGTQRPVVITAENTALLKGKALKYKVTRTDSEGREFTEIFYQEKTPVRQEVPIYREDARYLESNTYKTIRITISEVGVKPFEPVQIENASVEVSLLDVTEPYIVKEGDLIDMNRLLHIRIVPDAGYYMDGLGPESQLLEKDIHFFAFDLGAVLGENEIQPLIRVELDPLGKYGSCSFMLEGKEVSGSVLVKPSDWLTMTYHVSNTENKVSQKNDSFLDVLTRLVNGGTNTVRIPVTPDLEGSTISCDDNFIIEEKGR